MAHLNLWNKKFLVIIVLLNISLTSFSQNTRINTSENIAWYNFFGQFQLNNKTSIHAEYQWRRDNFISNWQQSLLRIGINYHLNPNVLFRVGYGWIETYNYGEIPLNSFGKDFTEHRIFQMAQISHKEGLLNISHRFMNEQRFIGRYNSAQSESEESYVYLNRLRYMLRLQYPIFNSINKHKPYLAFYNELFIGYGKNVNENIFDQNRIAALLGTKFNDKLRLEAGYLNQRLQFAREINGQNVFQNNNGLIVNLYLNL